MAKPNVALSQVKTQGAQTNAFDLSHQVMLSCNMGDLVPALCMECIPGDRISLSCENLVRMAPMIAPIMHRVDVYVEYFFVPERLVWENSEKYYTNGGDDPLPQPALPARPFFVYNMPADIGEVDYTKLMDYMGLPNPALGQPGVPGEKVIAGPFAAYQKIYNEYYRDQNLIDKVADTLVDGDNFSVSALYTMRKRAWEADRFTKSLPFAQKGEAVDIPLGAVLDDASIYVNEASYPSGVILDAPLSTPNNVPMSARPMDGSQLATNLFANTSELELGATTINDLRLAYQLQKYLEINARGGTRYSELIRAHYGVTPQDARLQRPEYIVGVKNPIQISEVLNTAGIEGELPQGNMAGHGVGYTDGNYGKYFCSEHGWIIGILSVMPKTVYMQGIPKMFLKYTDPTEIAMPVFAHLGEQPVQKREVFAFQDAAGVETFGYLPIFQEYKGMENRVAGQFRTTLRHWHMARYFETAPGLNEAFVTSDPTNRIFAVEDPAEDHLYCWLKHNIKAARKLPVFGTPMT